MRLYLLKPLEESRLYLIRPPEELKNPGSSRLLRLYLKKSSEELGRLLIKLKNPQSTQRSWKVRQPI